MEYILNFEEFVNEEKFINKDFLTKYADEILGENPEAFDLELQNGPHWPKKMETKSGFEAGDISFDKTMKECEKRFKEWEKLPEDVREKKHFQRTSKDLTRVKAICNVATSARMFGSDHIFTKAYLDALVRYHNFKIDDLREIFKK